MKNDRLNHSGYLGAPMLPPTAHPEPRPTTGADATATETGTRPPYAGHLAVTDACGSDGVDQAALPEQPHIGDF